MLEQIINGTSPLVDIQSERGEYVIFDDYSITPVHAKRSHKAMERAGDEDMVTDSLPDTTFIASDYTKIKRQDAKDMIVGIKRFPYSENKKGREPELWSLDDVIFSKGDKVKTPAAAVKRVQSKFKVKGTDEHPAIMITDEENRQHRAPYLEGIALLAENQREREETIEDMGSVEFIPYFKRGGKVYRKNVDQAFFGKIVKGIGKGLGAVGKGIFEVGKGAVDAGLTVAGQGNLINSGLDKLGPLNSVLGAAGKVAPFIPGIGQAIGVGGAALGTLGTIGKIGKTAGLVGQGIGLGRQAAAGASAGQLLPSALGLANRFGGAGGVNVGNLNLGQAGQSLGFLQNLFGGRGAQTQGVAGGIGSIGQLAGLLGQFGNLSRSGGQLPVMAERGGSVYKENVDQAQFGALFQTPGEIGTDAILLAALVANGAINATNIDQINDFNNEQRGRLADTETALSSILSQYGVDSGNLIDGLEGTLQQNNQASSLIQGLGILGQQAPADVTAENFSNRLSSIDQNRALLQNQSRGQQISPTLLKALSPQQQQLAIAQNIGANNSNASASTNALLNLNNQQGSLLDAQINATTGTDTLNANNQIAFGNSQLTGLAGVGSNFFTNDSNIADRTFGLRSQNTADLFNLNYNNTSDRFKRQFNLENFGIDKQQAREDKLSQDLLNFAAILKGNSATNFSSTNPQSPDFSYTALNTNPINTSINLPGSNCPCGYNQFTGTCLPC